EPGVAVPAAPPGGPAIGGPTVGGPAGVGGMPTVPTTQRGWEAIARPGERVPGTEVTKFVSNAATAQTLPDLITKIEDPEVLPVFGSSFAAAFTRAVSEQIEGSQGWKRWLEKGIGLPDIHGLGIDLKGLGVQFNMLTPKQRDVLAEYAYYRTATLRGAEGGRPAVAFIGYMRDALPDPGDVGFTDRLRGLAIATG